ncbi:MAG: hypothetical protein KBT04_07625 [Bacteroidales bacterium]|nr:hypothetical protein [Candidatus Colimorpha onthohippi]
MARWSQIVAVRQPERAQPDPQRQRARQSNFRLLSADEQARGKVEPDSGCEQARARTARPTMTDPRSGRGRSKRSAAPVTDTN